MININKYKFEVYYLKKLRIVNSLNLESSQTFQDEGIQQPCIHNCENFR